jgi:hypothetical protein
LDLCGWIWNVDTEPTNGGLRPIRIEKSSGLSKAPRFIKAPWFIKGLRDAEIAGPTHSGKMPKSNRAVRKIPFNLS